MSSDGPSEYAMGSAEILADKPERVLPLSPDEIERLRQMPNLVISEMAGRDAVAAIMACLGEDDVGAVLPIAVYTGTEYGDWRGFERNAAFVRTQAQTRYGKTVLDVLWLGSPELWRALNGRHITDIVSRFGRYSPCLACHSYLHALRIPIARQLGVTTIIGGDREQHNERCKINQIPYAIDSYRRLMQKYGIELREPLRHVADVADVDAILGPDWPGGSPQPSCLFSGNYYPLDDQDAWSTQHVASFLDDFCHPVLDAAILAYLGDETLDYAAIARAQIARVTKASPRTH